MRRDLYVYGGLLAFGLAIAYWASLPAADEAEDKVQVVSVDPKAVEEIGLSSVDGTAKVELTAKRDAGTGRYWIEHTKTDAPKEDKKKDAKNTGTGTGTGSGVAAAATGSGTSSGTGTDTSVAAADGTATDTATTKEAPPPKVTKERFLGNDKVDEFLKTFNPLVAARVISPAGDAQLEEFGLKDRTAQILLKDASGKILFGGWLGKRSYGSRNRFVLETKSDGTAGRVLLLADEGVENLERAPLRMYERKIVSFAVEEVTKAEVRSGGKAKRMAHTQRNKDGELLWSDDEENAAAKPSYDSWMDKIAKLRLTAYATDDEEKALAQVEPFLEVAFEKDGKEQDRLVFRKLVGEKTEYFVTSKFLGVQTKIVASRVEPIEKDIEAIVADNKS